MHEQQIMDWQVIFCYIVDDVGEMDGKRSLKLNHETDYLYKCIVWDALRRKQPLVFHHDHWTWKSNWKARGWNMKVKKTYYDAHVSLSSWCNLYNETFCFYFRVWDVRGGIRASDNVFSSTLPNEYSYYLDTPAYISRSWWYRQDNPCWCL